jgi:hypothetical protein
MNKVEVCNLALGAIGVGSSGNIQDFYPADTSEEARACTRFFPHCMSMLMREPSIDWAFARSSVALALSVDTVHGYAYTYIYPNDCARMVVLAPADVDPWRIPQDYWRWGGHSIRMASDGQSKLVASNLPDAIAHYIADVTDPSFADALFRDALKWSLAKDLSLELRTNPNMATNAAQQYAQSLSTASAANGNEGDDVERHTPADIAEYSCLAHDRRYPYG